MLNTLYTETCPRGFLKPMVPLSLMRTTSYGCLSLNTSTFNVHFLYVGARKNSCRNAYNLYYNKTKFMIWLTDIINQGPAVQFQHSNYQIKVYKIYIIAMLFIFLNEIWKSDFYTKKHTHSLDHSEHTTYTPYFFLHHKSRSSRSISTFKLLN